ncbi:hypothetical protein [Bradyrhizobium sp. JYMT SZCCT0428]|uniref:hypothetical protein n=1 Tax=Bradyrhizobium sp. JYMT SZCCT0428 TaxID=2807673 RepID=UPI001BAD4998|nr:hypothetical protein [Bradyrhizobium sp. JYMT SZCCT0428]MBR1155149.1 hypothetical protein [Bradyrhizobium sp. JYMT SZCCT0428]
MAAIDNANQSLVVTAFWAVSPGEEAAVANLLKDFLPQGQAWPGPAIHAWNGPAAGRRAIYSGASLA